MDAADTVRDARRPIALVTGASAGLGREFALLLAERGHDLVIVARREDRLAALRKEVGERFGVRAKVIVEDLSHLAAPRRILDELRASNLEVDVLVNNAGYALNGRFLTNDWAAHADFLQVMVGSWLDSDEVVTNGATDSTATFKTRVANSDCDDSSRVLTASI
jgi:short-subunit dehydrogenase